MFSSSVLRLRRGYVDRIFYCISKSICHSWFLPYLKSSTFMKKKISGFLSNAEKAKIEKKKKKKERKMTLEQTYLSNRRFSASFYKAVV